MRNIIEKSARSNIEEARLTIPACLARISDAFIQPPPGGA